MLHTPSTGVQVQRGEFLTGSPLVQLALDTAGGERLWLQFIWRGDANGGNTAGQLGDTWERAGRDEQPAPFNPPDCLNPVSTVRTEATRATVLRFRGGQGGGLGRQTGLRAERRS